MMECSKTIVSFEKEKTRLFLFLRNGWDKILLPLCCFKSCCKIKISSFRKKTLKANYAKFLFLKLLSLK